MRDKRKSEDYFSSYIDYQEGRISKKSAKLSEGESDSAKVERINQSLLRLKTDMVYAQFSAGADKNILSNYLEDALKTASQVISIDYETLLNLLSLSVLLGIKVESSEIISKYGDVIRDDKLLNCLAKYIEYGKVVWEGAFAIKGIYDNLNDLANATDKVSIINVYLSDWYDAHKDFAWYESHRNDKDTYVGYWSFESAALTKVMGIEESYFSDNEYYPIL